MNTDESTQAAEARQGDPADGGGTYTIDNGHPLSYDHEATPRYDYGLMVVTLTCECGKWSATAAIDPDEDTDDEPEALLADWEAHVYAATGQTPPEPDEDENDFCEAPVQVTMGVISGDRLVLAWSCLQHADQWATDLESTYGMAPERASKGSESMKCGHTGWRPMLLTVDPDEDEVPDDVIEIDMDAVRAFNRAGESK